jgi:hypothetical protein
VEDFATWVNKVLPNVLDSYEDFEGTVAPIIKSTDVEIFALATRIYCSQRNKYYLEVPNRPVSPRDAMTELWAILSANVSLVEVSMRHGDVGKPFFSLTLVQIFDTIYRCGEGFGMS